MLMKSHLEWSMFISFPEEKGLTLIDAGTPGKALQIIEVIEQLGFKAGDLNHILLTHFHMDHIGSLEDLIEKTGAKVYAHTIEAQVAGQIRPSVAAPGFLNKLIFHLFIKRSVNEVQTGAPVDVMLTGGEILDFANGLEVIHTPGHTLGHTSYLIHEEGGILILGDAASGGKKPGYPILFENKFQAMKTLQMIGNMNFQKACFSHGRTIDSNAPARFKSAFKIKT